MARTFCVPDEHVDNLLCMYGGDIKSLQICEEECLELAQAVSKYIRYIQKTTPKEYTEIRANVVEELSHAAISCAMVKKIFDVTEKELDDEVRKKAQECGFDDSKYTYGVPF